MRSQARGAGEMVQDQGDSSRSRSSAHTHSHPPTLSRLSAAATADGRWTEGMGCIDHHAQDQSSRGRERCWRVELSRAKSKK